LLPPYSALSRRQRLLKPRRIALHLYDLIEDCEVEGLQVRL
jgi:hypothetical protein